MVPDLATVDDRITGTNRFCHRLLMPCMIPLKVGDFCLRSGWVDQHRQRYNEIETGPCPPTTLSTRKIRPRSSTQAGVSISGVVIVMRVVLVLSSLYWQYPCSYFDRHRHRIRTGSRLVSTESHANVRWPGEYSFTTRARHFHASVILPSFCPGQLIISGALNDPGEPDLYRVVGGAQVKMYNLCGQWF